MKSVTRNAVIAMFCGLLPLHSIAGGFIGLSNIQDLQQRECLPNKGLQITLTATHANPDGCSNPVTIEVDCELPTYKSVLAMALTAQSANLQINGWVSGCDIEGQAKLKSIQIQ